MRKKSRNGQRQINRQEVRVLEEKRENGKKIKKNRIY